MHNRGDPPLARPGCEMYGYAAYLLQQQQRTAFLEKYIGNRTRYFYKNAHINFTVPLKVFVKLKALFVNAFRKYATTDHFLQVSICLRKLWSK